MPGAVKPARVINNNIKGIEPRYNKSFFVLNISFFNIKNQNYDAHFLSTADLAGFWLCRDLFKLPNRPPWPISPKKELVRP